MAIKINNGSELQVGIPREKKKMCKYERRKRVNEVNEKLTKINLTGLTVKVELLIVVVLLLLNKIHDR